MTFLREVLATKPALMVATVRDAPHCWHRRNMMRVALSLSNRVSGLLQLLHSTYLQAFMIAEAHQLSWSWTAEARVCRWVHYAGVATS